jgi:hypothetical protein
MGTRKAILCPALYLSIWVCDCWAWTATAMSADPVPASAKLWDLAKAKQGIHRFSTLFTAHQVRDHLSTEGGIDAAIDWCRRTGVTKVYIEAFRDGYQAKREALRHAKERFQAAGFEVSGCVTTTGIGKRSTGWGASPATRTWPPRSGSRRSSSTRRACSTRSMIDDFWFTDCQCPQCDAARKAKTVRSATDLPGGR